MSEVGAQQTAGATRLWRELAQAQDAALQAQERARSAGSEAAAFAAAHGLGRARPRKRLGRLPLVLAMAACAAVVVGVVSTLTRKQTLSVQLGTSAPRGEAIPSLVADARHDLPLRFSDGSTVTFRAGSSGQLQKLNSAGAELVLSRGALQAHVIHALATSWILHAGPYRVRVTGTRFGLSWRSERLELSLYEGSVVVDGAALGSGVPVRAGQRLTVASGVVHIEPLGAAATVALASPAREAQAHDARDREARGNDADVREAQHDEREVHPAASELNGAAAPSRGEAGPGLAPAPPRAVRSRAAGARGGRHARHVTAGAGNSTGADDEWQTLADRGAYREALEAAKRVGWGRLCGRLDARRLLTLADVARYSDAPRPAHRAFEALVKRFPDDRLAADAVFSLGRLAFEGGRPAEAARWFHRYVSDWPKGPLAEQAAGRLLESTIRLQDPDAAHAAARAYLARAPHGAQAGLARGVLADATDGTSVP